MSAERLLTAMAGVPRGRRTWAVPLLLVLAVVIVAALAFNLANLEPGQESVAETPRRPSLVAAGVPDSIASILLVGLGVVLLGGVVLLVLRVRKHPRQAAKPRSWWDLFASVLGLVLFLAILIAVPRAVRPEADAETAAANTTAEGGLGLPWPIASGWPIELFLLLTVFVSLVWVMYRLRPRRRSLWVGSLESFEFPVARAGATTVVEETIRDLETGGDVREAILACFQRFCRLLGFRGINEQVALTPRELEGLAVRNLGVSRDASETLTSLFEEARYSEHPLGDFERRRAIESLGRIQAALEA